MKTILTPMHLEQFLIKHSISNERLARILGVTKPAISHWLESRRGIPPVVAKLIVLIDRNPKLADDLESIT